MSKNHDKTLHGEELIKAMKKGTYWEISTKEDKFVCKVGSKQGTKHGPNKEIDRRNVTLLETETGAVIGRYLFSEIVSARRLFKIGKHYYFVKKRL